MEHTFGKEVADTSPSASDEWLVPAGIHSLARRACSATGARSVRKPTVKRSNSTRASEGTGGIPR